MQKPFEIVSQLNQLTYIAMSNMNFRECGPINFLDVRSWPYHYSMFPFYSYSLGLNKEGVGIC